MVSTSLKSRLERHPSLNHGSRRLHTYGIAYVANLYLGVVGLPTNVVHDQQVGTR